MEDDNAQADMGPVTSLEAMRSVSNATSTVAKRTTTVAGTAVKKHSPVRSSAVKAVGGHTVRHSKPK